MAEYQYTRTTTANAAVVLDTGAETWGNPTTVVLDDATFSLCALSGGGSTSDTLAVTIDQLTNLLPNSSITGLIVQAQLGLFGGSGATVLPMQLSLGSLIWSTSLSPTNSWANGVYTWAWNSASLSGVTYEHLTAGDFAVAFTALNSTGGTSTLGVQWIYGIEAVLTAPVPGRGGEVEVLSNVTTPLYEAERDGFGARAITIECYPHADDGSGLTSQEDMLVAMDPHGRPTATGWTLIRKGERMVLTDQVGRIRRIRAKARDNANGGTAKGWLSVTGV